MKSMVAVVIALVLVGCTTTPKEMQAGDRPEQVFKSVLAPRIAANCLARNQMNAGEGAVTVLEADNTFEVAAQYKSLFFVTTTFYAKVSSADEGSTIRFWGYQGKTKVVDGCL
jgi:uncharacterized protein YcfL